MDVVMELEHASELRAAVTAASDEYNAGDTNRDGDIDFAE